MKIKSQIITKVRQAQPEIISPVDVDVIKHLEVPLDELTIINTDCFDRQPCPNSERNNHCRERQTHTHDNQ